MIRATHTQWIKFAVVLALYLIFLVWLRSWLGLVVVPFIFDAYITKKIPWTWWRESKNRHVVTVILCQPLFLPELCDSFFFAGKIIADG